MAVLLRIRRPGLDALLALQDRHQRLPDGVEASPDPGAAIRSDRLVRRTRPPADSRCARRGLVAGTAARRMDRPARRRSGRGGDQTRVAKAGTHRQHAAPARPPTRDPHPARSAGVLRGRDRGDHGHQHRGGQERSAARPCPPGRIAAGARGTARTDRPTGTRAAGRLHRGLRALRRQPAGTGAAHGRHAGGDAVPRLAGGPG